MKHPLIAREGWPYLAGSLVVSLLATALLGVWSLPFWMLTLFILQFFRDPVRTAPAGDGLVISPADGRVIKVEAVSDPYLGRDALLVSVFMNVFNVHSNKSPVDGEIRARWYSPGKFINASFDKASSENERNALHISTPHGDVVAVQIAGLVARRILCYVEPGALLVRGQRYGFIRFGSRVDLYLPRAAQTQVSLGQVVQGGKTILARLAG
jgi:phosphatidylserine decarboxylase